MTQRDAFDLEAAFDAARAEPPQMPAALMGRIVADAQRHQPQMSLWRKMIAAVGGPAGAGGLVTATFVGFWMGVSPPQSSVDPLAWIGVTDLAVDDDMADVLEFGWYSDEG